MANIRKLRLLVTVCVIGVLAWVLIDRLDREPAEAERQHVRSVLSQLRAALVVKGAEVMLQRDGDLQALAGTNAFELLNHGWEAYRGPCRSRSLPAGGWCFQPDPGQPVDGRGRLIYRVRQPIMIEGRLPGEDGLLAWQVSTDYADRNRNGRREPGERVTGLTLIPVPLTGKNDAGQDESNSRVQATTEVEL